MVNGVLDKPRLSHEAHHQGSVRGVCELVLKSLSRQDTVKTPYYGRSAVGSFAYRSGTHLLHSTASLASSNTLKLCATAKLTRTHLQYSAPPPPAHVEPALRAGIRRSSMFDSVTSLECSHAVTSLRIQSDHHETRNRRVGCGNLRGGPSAVRACGAIRARACSCQNLTPTAQRAQPLLVNKAHIL